MNGIDKYDIKKDEGVRYLIWREDYDVKKIGN